MLHHRNGLIQGNETGCFSECGYFFADVCFSKGREPGKNPPAQHQWICFSNCREQLKSWNDIVAIAMFFTGLSILYLVDLKTICSAHTFLILKPVWEAFCIMTESQISFVFVLICFDKFLVVMLYLPKPFTCHSRCRVELIGITPNLLRTSLHNWHSSIWIFCKC